MEKKMLGVIYVKLFNQSDIDSIEYLKKKFDTDASKIVRGLIRDEYRKQLRRRTA